MSEEPTKTEYVPFSGASLGSGTGLHFGGELKELTPEEKMKDLELMVKSRNESILKLQSKVDILKEIIENNFRGRD